jgi:hypothetical protein
MGAVASVWGLSAVFLSSGIILMMNAFWIRKIILFAQR